MVQSLSDRAVQFIQRDFCGVTVAFLPPASGEHSAADLEKQLVETPLREAFKQQLKDKTVLFASTQASPYPNRYSITQALVQSYYQSLGGRGKFSKMLNTITQTASTIHGDWSWSLVNMGLSMLSNTPVKGLAQGKHSPQEVRDTLKQLCSNSDVVLYIRKAHRDHHDSRAFLIDVLGTGLDLALDEHYGRFWGVIAVPYEARNEPWVEHIRDSDNNRFIDLLDLNVDASAFILTHLPLPAADPIASADTLALSALYLMGVYSYFTGDRPIEPVLLERSLGQPVAEALAYWCDKRLINAQRVAVNGEEVTLYSVSEETDGITLMEQSEAALTARNAALVATAQIPLEVAVERRYQVQACRALYAAQAMGADRSDLMLVNVLLSLAKGGDLQSKALGLMGALLEPYLKANDPDGLLELLLAYQEQLDEFLNLTGTLPEEDRAPLGRFILHLGRVLDKTACHGWGLLQGIAASMLEKFFDRAPDYIPEVAADSLRQLYERNTPWVFLLTRQGHAKLVSLNHIATIPRYAKRGVSFIEAPASEVQPSEIDVVNLGLLGWLFTTSKEVIAFPYRQLEARYELNRQWSFENLSATLELAAGEYVLANCAFDPRNLSDEGFVLLVGERGEGHVIPRELLPLQANERHTLASDLLKPGSSLRWAVWVEPDEMILVGTTGNRVVQLDAASLLKQRSKVIPALVTLGEGDLIAALATAPKDPHLDSFVFFATDGGYGRIVPTQEFRIGRVGLKGAIGQKPGKHAGSLRTVESVPSHGEFLLCTAHGEVTRLARESVPIRNRATVGVKLIAMAAEDQLVCGCAYG